MTTTRRRVAALLAALGAGLATATGAAAQAAPEVFRIGYQKVGVVVVAEIPMDPRHGSKIDRVALRKLR